MDQDDDNDWFLLVSVDELGTPGLWASVKDLLESRSVLQHLTVHNKVGRAVAVDRLSLQFVASTDKRLQRLRPYARSPVVWFRHPYAHILLVATADASEYRNVVKPALKRAISDLEHDWGGPPAPVQPAPQPTGMGALLGGGSAAAGPPVGVLGAEWLIVYVRPADLDLTDKAAKKVYDKLKDDFSTRGRTRVIRVDAPKGYSAAALAAVAGSGGAAAAAASMAGNSSNSSGGPWATPRGGSGPVALGVGGGAAAGVLSAGAPMSMLLPGNVLGLEDLELCLRECVRTSFEARQAAYMAEVQRLANERRDPNWSFSSLYLVKDTLARLLEGFGLNVDAYKEYVELEAAYQETLDRQSAQGQGQPGQQAPAGSAAPAVATAALAASSAGAAATAGSSGLASAGPTGDEGPDDMYGASGEGADVATLTNASWRATRRSTLKRSAVQEFRFRQYLFAAQSRLLLRLGRPVDVAEKGLRFIGAVAAELGRREKMPHGGVRPLLREAWTFSACLAVVTAVTACVFGRDPAAAGAGHAGSNPPPAGVPGAGAGVGGTLAAGGAWDGPEGAAAGEGAGTSVHPGDAGAGMVRASRVAASPFGAEAASVPVPAAGTAAAGANRARGLQEPDATGGPPGGPAAAHEERAEGADGGGPPQPHAAFASASTAAQQPHPHHPHHPPVDSIDWQLWSPFEADVPGVDLMSLCGQAINPAALSAPKPADPEVSLRQTTFQAFMLALAHLYNSARCALLQLATRAAREVVPLPHHLPPHGAAAAEAPGGAGPAHSVGGDGEEAEEWAAALAEWRQGLLDLGPQYPCRGVVGMFVDQEEDRQFEVTPQQQATQLQLLRQTISGMAAGAGAGGVGVGVGMGGGGGGWMAAGPVPQTPAPVVGTPRGDGSPVVANSTIWLTPPAPEQPGYGGRSHHHRAESLFNVNITGGSSSASGPAAGPPPATATAPGPGGLDPWDSAANLHTAARGSVGAASGPGGRVATVTWAADASEGLLQGAGGSAGPGAAGPGDEPARSPGAGGGRGRHGHSSSADNANTGSLFARLDNATGGKAPSSQADPRLRPPHPQPPTNTTSNPLVEASAQGPPVHPGAPTNTPSSTSTTTAAGHATTIIADTGGSPSTAVRPPSGLGPWPAAPAAAGAVMNALPPELSWLREWRLRAALSSPAQCANLALQLALTTATCYSRAGRQRTAAQLFGDVGSVLLGRGQAEVVAELMDTVVKVATTEGWLALLGRALPVLMAAQQAIGHVMLPYTCMRYLSLPPQACQSDVRRAVLEHVLASAGCPPSGSEGGAAGPGGLGRPRRLPVPSAVLQLSTMYAIRAAVLPGSTSKFFGTQCCNGQPSLVPPARKPPPFHHHHHHHLHHRRSQQTLHHQKQGPEHQQEQEPLPGEGEGGGGGHPGGGRPASRSGGGGGAQLLRVGDVCALRLQVYSNLPEPVALTDMHLVLATLLLPQAPQQQQQQQQQYPPVVAAYAPGPPPSGATAGGGRPPQSQSGAPAQGAPSQVQSGTQPQPLLQQQQQPPTATVQRSSLSSFSNPAAQQQQQQSLQLSLQPLRGQAQGAHHHRNLSGGDIPAAAAAVSSLTALPPPQPPPPPPPPHAWRPGTASAVGSGGAGHGHGSALAQYPPPASGGPRGAAPDRSDILSPTAHTAPLQPHQQAPAAAAAGYPQPQPQPLSQYPPPQYNNTTQQPQQPQHPHYPQVYAFPPPHHAHHISQPGSSSGLLLATHHAGSVSSGLAGPHPSTAPGSPTYSAPGGGGGGGAAFAVSGQSRLAAASRGSALTLERNVSSTSNSSLSLGPGGGGGGAGVMGMGIASYSNLSDSSGLGRRAPSWPDALSAATSFAQGPGSNIWATPPFPGAGSATGMSSVAGAPRAGGGGGDVVHHTSSGGGLTSPVSQRGGAGPGGGWAAGEDLTCYHLVEVEHVEDDPEDRQTAASKAQAPASGASPQGTRGAHSGDPRVVVLRPGLTHLTFRVAPTRPGLYFVRNIAASLGSYDVRIPVVPADELAMDVRALCCGWAATGGGGGAAAGGGGSGSAATRGGVAASGGSFTFGSFGYGGAGGGAVGATAAALARLGRVTEGGEVQHWDVVLQVGPLVPRLLAAPVAVGGALTAGLPQWLGVALAPLDAEPESEPSTRGSGGVAAGPEDGEDGGGGGLQHVRVHVQARSQAAIRLGDWPPPAAATPAAALSTMPSIASAGGAPFASTPTPTAAAAAAAAAAGFGTSTLALSHDSLSLADLPSGGIATASSYGIASGGAFATPAAAAAYLHHHHHHHHHPAGVAVSASAFRRGDAGGLCRVAVVDLRRAARQESGGGGGAGAAAAAAGASSGRGFGGAAAVAAPPPRLPGHETGGGGGVAAGGVSWALSTRQGIDLSQALSGPLRSPVLLWMPVWVPPAVAVAAAGAGGGGGPDDKAASGVACVAPELVRVQQAHAGVASSRYPAITAAGGGRRPGVRAQQPDGSNNGRDPLLLRAASKGAAPPGQRALPALELEVVVEGLQGGVWRSYASSLAVPLQQPFRVRTTAHQLPDSQVLVAATLTSNLALPVLLTDVVLEPQYGLVLATAQPDAGGAVTTPTAAMAAAAAAAGAAVPGGTVAGLLAAVPGLLPLQVAPHQAVTWAFMLTRSQDSAPSLPGLLPDDCCVLHLAYHVAPGAAAPAAGPEEILGPALQPVSGYRYPLPPLTTGHLPELDTPGGAGPGSGAPASGALQHFPSAPLTTAAAGPPPLWAQGPSAASFRVSAAAAATPGGSSGGAGFGQVPPPPPLASAHCGAPGVCPNIYSHTGTYGGAVPSTPAAAAVLAASMSIGGAAVQGGAAAANLTFSHGFLLEFPASNALTHNLVSVRLLGPYNAVLGQPVHLTWLVTRVSSPPAAVAAAAASAGGGGGGGTAPFADGTDGTAGADVAVYEVAEVPELHEGAAGGGGSLYGGGLVGATVGTAAAGGGAGGSGTWQWRQAVGCRGSVRLGRAKGSVAVVEAAVVPLAGGLLHAPVLRLRGLREVRDEEAPPLEYVVVSPG